MNWKGFIKNNDYTNEEDNDNNNKDDNEFGFEFADQQTQEYMDLMDKLKKSKTEVEVVSTKDEDWIDMDDI